LDKPPSRKQDSSRPVARNWHGTSRKAQIQHGVPQGGVLSPTLFLICINHVTANIRRSAHSSLYADDLALWTSERHISTASTQMQNALRSLESWSSNWLLKINEGKTTYTSSTLSSRKQVAKLILNGKVLRKDETPNYLGITLVWLMTWGQHINKSHARAKLRLAIMRKLAGTAWGAVMKVLKKLYVGRVRPVLEYGMSAWSSSSKSSFGKIHRLQNSAARIIPGALRSKPVNRIESITGLQPMEDRQTGRVLQQAEKFNELTRHPIHDRIKGYQKGRLKRTNFVAMANGEIRKHDLEPSPAAVSLTANVPTPHGEEQCSRS
jgi:hypothetical protein